jgi:hypothetical protein
MSVIGVMELSFFSLCIWQEFILIGEEFVGIMVGIEELNNCFGLIAVEFDDVDGASEGFGASYIHRISRRCILSLSDHASPSSGQEEATLTAGCVSSLRVWGNRQWEISSTECACGTVCVHIFAILLRLDAWWRQSEVGSHSPRFTFPFSNLLIFRIWAMASKDSNVLHFRMGCTRLSEEWFIGE